MGMPMQQPGAPHNMAAPPVGFPAPGPSFPQPAVRSPSPSASGAAAQLGFPAHNPLAQAFPHHPPGTSLAQGPLLVVQQQAGVHTGPHACPHPGHPGHPGQAPTLQPSPPVGHQPGFGQPAPYPGAAHAAMAGFSPAAGSAPVVAAQYHAGQQLQHQQQAHLSPSHLSPVVRGSPQSQGGSSRSNSLSTSLSNSSLDNISPPQHATSHVYRHLHRQSSKSPYFNPARSPKVNSTSPLALTPRTSLGNAAPPLPGESRCLVLLSLHLVFLGCLVHTMPVPQIGYKTLGDGVPSALLHGGHGFTLYLSRMPQGVHSLPFLLTSSTGLAARSDRTWGIRRRCATRAAGGAHSEPCGWAVSAHAGRGGQRTPTWVRRGWWWWGWWWVSLWGFSCHFRHAVTRGHHLRMKSYL